jgi:tRNA-dihydrouridine synthase A
VQTGSFGACLMREPELVAQCVRAMRDAVALPVTVKHRIGLDADEEYGLVRDFVGAVADAGCDVFIVHARNAVLKGLSPKENREVPRLRYDVVHRLKREFPGRTFVLNGGLTTWTAIERELELVDGVMLGRAAYHDPMILAPVDWRLFGADQSPPTRVSLLRTMVPYVAAQRARGVPLRSIARHMLGLYHGMPGGRRFRQLLSDAARLQDAGPELLMEALDAVEPALATT